MAGDWIKMRVGLTAHPRVRKIAECLLKAESFLAWSGFDNSNATSNASLRVTRYVTVTALLRFWGYANEHAKGEEIAGVWPEDVDEVTGVPGFGDAIEAAGWVVFDRQQGGLSMPNFEEHNVSAIERGSSAAERQRRYRERKKAEAQAAESGKDVTHSGDVTRDVTVTRREEKRREEKKEVKTKGTPLALPDWLPSDAWNGYLEMRKRIKKVPTDRALELVLKALEGMRNNGQDIAAVLDKSTVNNWIDVYPIREERRNGARLGPEHRGQQSGNDIYAANRAVVEQMMAQEGQDETYGQG
jgi:hypothetical protein